VTGSPEPATRPSLLPVVLGFVFAGVLLLVIGFWTAQRQKNQPIDVPPTARLIVPAGDTTVGTRLTVTFETSVPLRLGAAGWAAGRYHLHALLDSVELMPGANDIRQLPTGSYSWTVSGVRPGRFQLVWARPDHTRLDQGASQRIRLLPQ
jgi:hypothetical protein